MDSRGVRASARKRLQRSSRSTDATAHSLVHLINCDGKHRRGWLRPAPVPSPSSAIPPPQSFAQPATHSYDALGGPTFGARAAPWAYDGVAIKGLRPQQRTDRGLVLLGNLQADGRSAMLCSCAQRQIAILLGDVRLACLYAVGIKPWHTNLANRRCRKTNASLYAAEARQHG